jgi:hypothetical protein
MVFPFWKPQTAPAKPLFPLLCSVALACSKFPFGNCEKMRLFSIHQRIDIAKIDVRHFSRRKRSSELDLAWIYRFASPSIRDTLPWHEIIIDGGKSGVRFFFSPQFLFEKKCRVPPSSVCSCTHRDDVSL